MAAPVIVGGETATNAGTGTTLATSITTGGSRILILGLSKQDSTAGTTAAITDNSGASLVWTPVKTITEQAGRWSQQFWAFWSGSGAITVTATFSASATARSWLYGVNGSDTTTPIIFSDKTQVAVSGTSHACAASAITPTSNHLGFAVWAFNNTTGIWVPPADNGVWNDDGNGTGQGHAANLTAGAGVPTTVVGTSTSSRTSSNCCCFLQPPSGTRQQTMSLLGAGA